jgi:transcription termination/antitermination protein NusG
MNMEYVKGQIVGYVPIDDELIAVPMPKCWYILQVHPGREFKVMKKFRQYYISGWLPLITTRQEVTRYRRGYEWKEFRNVVSPLISGVVLIPDFEDGWQGVDGVIGLYRMDQCFPRLMPNDIIDLRNIEAIGNTPKSKRKHLFEIGELVRVVNGPFRDFCARVERFDSKGRLSVGVEIFGRITPIELSEDDIVAAGHPRVSGRGGRKRSSFRRNPSR